MMTANPPSRYGRDRSNCGRSGEEADRGWTVRFKGEWEMVVMS